MKILKQYLEKKRHVLKILSYTKHNPKNNRKQNFELREIEPKTFWKALSTEQYAKFPNNEPLSDAVVSRRPSSILLLKPKSGIKGLTFRLSDSRYEKLIRKCAAKRKIIFN